MSYCYCTIEMGNNMKNESIEWHDDGLTVIERGPWSEKKSRILFNYLQIFSTGMKRLWKHRVYVDPYSGPDCVRLQPGRKTIMGSPLLSLAVRVPFDRYLFCEADSDSLSALKARVRTRFTNFDVEFVEGDCNCNIDEIVEKMGRDFSKDEMLVFCFVDPSDIGLRMETIRILARSFPRIDFLVLLALFMDSNRNESHYVKPSNTKVDSFLGDNEWREKWIEFRKEDKSFPRFLSRAFSDAMFSEGYLKGKESNTVEFRSSEKNLPLYHLAFFSRHARGYDFWKKGKKYALDQGTLDFFE